MPLKGPLNAEQRARAKYNAARRANGIPALVPNDTAVVHVRKLHDVHGMPLQLIADTSGCSMGCVYNQYKQLTSVIQRRNRDKLLAVEPFMGELRGAFVDPLITARKLGALGAIGFPLRWLAPHVGNSATNLFRAYNGKAQYVFAATERAVARVYGELSERKPSEFDITPNSQHVAQFYAIEVNGHAPPMCWDDDTINDPSAKAEWTGHCGTRKGVRIHYRDGITPLCRPCAAINAEMKRERSHAQRPSNGTRTIQEGCGDVR